MTHQLLTNQKMKFNVTAVLLVQLFLVIVYA